MTIKEKILNHLELSEKEVLSIVNYGVEGVEIIKEFVTDETYEMHETTHDVIKIEDHYFKIFFDRGFGEFGTDVAWKQVAKEVFKKTKLMEYYE